MQFFFLRRAMMIACAGAAISFGLSEARAQYQQYDDGRNRNQSSPPDASYFEEARQGQDEFRTQQDRIDRNEQQRSYRTQQREQMRQGDRSRSGQGEQGGLGVSLQEGREGVRITRVMQGTPAQEAGLREGDQILEINGSPVQSPESVVDRIRGKQAGEEVELVILRQGRERTMDVELTSRQEALSREQREQQQMRQGRQTPYEQYSQDRDLYDDFGTNRFNAPPRPNEAAFGGSQQQIQQLARQVESLQRQVAQLQRELRQMRGGQGYDAQRTGYETEMRDTRYQQDWERDYDRGRGSYQRQDQRFDSPRFDDRNQQQRYDQQQRYQQRGDQQFD